MKVKGSDRTQQQVKAPQIKKKNSSISERTSRAYNTAIQDFSQWLYRKGWVIGSFMSACLLGEPLETFKSAVRKVFGWKSDFEKKGFYDAGDPKSLKKLKADLKQNPSHAVPVLGLHSLAASPSIFKPWAENLAKARDEKRIGHFITLQLPNDLSQRMEIVYRTIEKISKIYQKRTGQRQVDLIGHSLGGYSAHLAAYLPEALEIKDKEGVVRRWHKVGNKNRNPLVRKVVSIAAPTWLCCHGQKDKTSPKQKIEDIYPVKATTEKSIKKAYTRKQRKTIRKYHKNIFDVVGSYDAISPIISPLRKKQIITVPKGHNGIISSKKVGMEVIALLSAKGAS